MTRAARNRHLGPWLQAAICPVLRCERHKPWLDGLRRAVRHFKSLTALECRPAVAAITPA
jgi:hypothetical protein